jgi:hypothetical protein
MRIRLAVSLLSVILALTALGAPQTTKNAAGEAAIRKVFEDYRKALLDGNGAAAVDLVSSRTVSYYGEILEHSLKMPRERVAGLDFVSKFMVLRLRHEFSRAEIAGMTGKELLILAVNKGWISKSSVSNVELAEIKVGRIDASASMTVAPGIPALHFQNESGQWKLHLLASFELANAAMKEQIKESGLTEDQFIIRILNMLSPQKVDEAIFSGPRD